MSTNNNVVYTVSLKDQLSSGLNQANTKANALDNTMRGIGSTLAGLGIAYAGAAFLKDSVKQWNESEQSLAQLNATLKSTGGAVGLSSDALQAQAKALQNITTYDAGAVIGMQSLLTKFTQIKGAIFTEAVPAIVDLSAKMGTDLKGSAIQVGKALNDPIKGVSALQRVGVSFTESQKKLIKTLVETNDIAGAQKIILGELNTEFGGSAEAMGKAGLGPITMMQNKLNDVKEEIGGLVAKIVIGLMPTIEKMVKGLGMAVQWIKEHQKTVSSLAVSIGTLVIGMSVAIPVMEGFGIATATALGPIGLLAAGIMAVVVAMNFLSDAYDNVREKEMQQVKFRRDAQVGIYEDRYKALQKKSGLSMPEFIKKETAELNRLVKENDDANAKALLSGGKVVPGLSTDPLFAQRRLALESLGGASKLAPTSAIVNASKTDKTSKASTRSTSSGHQVTTINMSIKELIHEFNVNTTNVKEGAYKVGEMITNAITAALNDSQLIVK